MYSAFGGMVEGLPSLHPYYIVLMVRDPRDVLVSQYFSLAFSHKRPARGSNKSRHFMNLRNTARQFSIDEFVVQQSDSVFEVYEKYRTGLLNVYPHTYVTRFEDMVENFSDWLDGLLQHSDLTLESDKHKQLIERNEAIRPKKEDPAREMRKGKHGDFAEKLSRKTIDFLNEKFSRSLADFGYSDMTAGR